MGGRCWQLKSIRKQTPFHQTHHHFSRFALPVVANNLRFLKGAVFGVPMPIRRHFCHQKLGTGRHHHQNYLGRRSTHPAKDCNSGVTLSKQQCLPGTSLYEVIIFPSPTCLNPVNSKNPRLEELEEVENIHTLSSIPPTHPGLQRGRTFPHHLGLFAGSSLSALAPVPMITTPNMSHAKKGITGKVHHLADALRRLKGRD